MAGEGDAERLVVLLEARITDFEKNLAKASGTATRNYGAMRKSSKSATAAMEADMVRSTARINQALASTSTRIGSFSKSFAVGMIAPIAGLVSLQAAISGTKAALEKFGDISDKSLAAGVDSEFFQGIAYQAKLSGVEIDTVASALASFAKNSGLAAEGKGRMVSTLQALNPELLRNIQLATTQEERIRLVADAIANSKDAAQAAAIASATLGDAGVKLVAAFQGGAAELDVMLAKAKDMGLIVDRDLVARADELGDKLDTAAQIVDLKLNRAFIDLAPLMVDAVGWAGEFAKLMAIAYEQTKAIEDRQFIRPLQNQLVAVENQRFDLMDGIAALKDEIASLGDGGSAGMLNGQLAGMEDQLTGLTDQALKLQQRINELSGAPHAGAASPTTPAKPTSAASSPNTMGGADIDLALNSMPDARKIDEVATGYKRVSTEAHAATISIASGADAVGRLKEQFQDAEYLAQSFSSTLISDMMSGRGGVESLGDAFSQLSEQLIQMAADQAIKSLFSNLLGAALGGGFGSISTGAAIPTGGFIPGLTGPRLFANGTANTGGQRGEPKGIVHGQEAVIPLPNGGRVPVDVRGMVPATRGPASGSSSSETTLRLIMPDGWRAEVVNEARSGARDDAVKIVQANQKARNNLYENGNPR